LARLDENEELILSIDECEGSVYERIATKWRVNWHDFTTTWETYRAVQHCTQLKEFASCKISKLRAMLYSPIRFPGCGEIVPVDSPFGCYPLINRSLAFIDG